MLTAASSRIDERQQVQDAEHDGAEHAPRFLLEAQDRDRVAHRVVDVRLREPRALHQRGELGLGRFDRNARAKPRVGVELCCRSTPAGSSSLAGSRQPDPLVHRERIAFRHDADDARGLPVDPRERADDVRVARKRGLPGR